MAISTLSVSQQGISVCPLSEDLLGRTQVLFAGKKEKERGYTDDPRYINNVMKADCTTIRSTIIGKQTSKGDGTCGDKAGGKHARTSGGTQTLVGVSAPSTRL